MSLHRLGESAARILASRPYRLALALLALVLSAVLAYLRSTRRPQRSRLVHEGILCRIELGLYHVFIVPLIAFLPAPLAYGLARLQGDLRYHIDRSKREIIMHGLEGILGNQMSLEERTRVTRDYFRHLSCWAVDVMRLTGKGRALKRLVEIRGLEHLEAALAAGKGAILAGAHFGSYDSCFSLIGAQGFPITTVGRIPSKLNRNRTFIERLIIRLFIVKPQARYRQRPNIEPRGQLESAVQVAAILRKNELVGICIDSPALPADRSRAVPMDFLNGQALLLPGATMIAQLTGAPVLMTFMRRSPDWQHQILEISPPVPMDGDAVTAYRRCLAAVEAAIRENPAHWHYWGKFVLMDLGLLSEESSRPMASSSI